MNFEFGEPIIDIHQVVSYLIWHDYEQSGIKEAKEFLNSLEMESLTELILKQLCLKEIKS